jgi:hypothetical protein
MAQITRIEVANFLTEGYGHGQQWDPLYRGVTMPVSGQSAAIQLDNGCGKTSIVDACLFLLSRNRRLRERVKPRMAPSDKSWTHIRIEFGVKADGEDIAQSSLITPTPEEFPGASYVIGLVWNRDVDQPRFYRYQGLFGDAPCYKRPDENTLELVSNEDFRKSVEKMPGARWDKWARISDWLEEIRFFTNLDVIQQNVEFQLKGGGDYSAELLKIRPKNGEFFDVAFFREIVAPELLSHPMGSEGDEEGRRFEDGLLLSIKATTNAILDVAKRDSELKQVSLALDRFDPVLEQADEVVGAEQRQKEEIAKLTKTGALLKLFVERDPLPGVPVVSKTAGWAKDAKIVQALSCLVIDKREGVLITDEGLSKLTRIPSGEINKRSREGIAVDSQAFELQQHLKNIAADDQEQAANKGQLQHIDSERHLKKDGRGGRRYAVTGYHLPAALSLLSALANLSGARTQGLSDTLTQAFGVAETEIDTNPYRKLRRGLRSDLNTAKGNHGDAKTRLEKAQAQYEVILTEEREAAENQVAYEGFMARQAEFPEELLTSPIKAKEWAEHEDTLAQQAKETHIKRVATLDKPFEHWKTVSAMYPMEALAEALARLTTAHNLVVEANREAQEAAGGARQQKARSGKDLEAHEQRFRTASDKHILMESLRASMPRYQEIFGEVDPGTLNPQKDVREAAGRKAELERKREDATRSRQALQKLLPDSEQFKEVFGDEDPAALDPIPDLRKRNEDISVEQSIINEHLPLVESLNLFRETHPEIMPDAWLREADARRGSLGIEKNGLTEEIEDLEKQLAGLDRYALADDRIYDNALAALDDVGISYERLHQVVEKAASGSRRAELLTLFSAMLSAPVVSNLDTASQATRILEEDSLTVPVFVSKALSDFIRGGSITLSGDVAQHLFVGRRTRQVDILLDPSLIASEKERINGEIKAHDDRIQDIDGLLEQISLECEAVRLAMSARDAVSKGSERRLGEAQANLARLEADLPQLNRRAESVSLIDAEKSFRKLGGHEALRALNEDSIPALEEAIEEASGTLAAAEARNTDEAHEVRRDVQRFLIEGGEPEFEAVYKEVSKLGPALIKLREHDGKLGESLRELEEAANTARTNLDASLAEFPLAKKALDDAIAFDVDDNVEFMREESTTRVRLDEDAAGATNRLRGIDFTRAQAYVNRTDEQARSHADRKIEAEARRNGAVQDEQRYREQVTALEGQLGELAPFMEALDEAVGALLAKYRNVAELGPEIREQLLLDPSFMPDAMETADRVRLAITTGKASTHQEVRALLGNLRTDIEAMELDTKPYKAADRELRHARRLFQDKRNDFVSRVESGEIKGLHATEIDLIRNAASMSDLTRIRAIRQTIDSQAKQLEQDLNQCREAVATQKAANIEILTNLANQATTNLAILEDVMKRTPAARFHIDVKIADSQRISQIIESLINEVEDRERHARERSTAVLNDEIERRNTEYKDLIRERIYQNMFSEPRVEFCHPAIWNGDRRRLVNEGPSTGQLTALMMMWIIKQADYALTRVVRLYSSRKEQKQALKKMQRVLFIDGLFSNLSNDDIINGAFRGLREVSEGFQLLGFIHNPHYINNPDLFPVHLVGKKFASKSSGTQRTWVAVNPWQKANGVGFFTSAFRKAPAQVSSHA